MIENARRWFQIIRVWTFIWLQKRKRSARRFDSLVLIVVFAWVNLGISAGADETLKITAPAMFAAYDENEIAADQKFKGKIIEVSGTVKSIAKDILGNPYVTLAGGGLVLQVQCFLAEDAVNDAASLHPNQKVTLIGKFNSKFGNILIKDCKIRSQK